MIRFFVTPQELSADSICLTGENAAHAKVLRLHMEEQIILCDGAGQECICTITQFAPNQVIATVQQRRCCTTESPIKVSIYMAYAKGDKIEHVIQKATELGAYEIVTFPTHRCVSRPDAKSLDKKAQRWQKIAHSAAQQSGRGIIPQVVICDSYEQALQRGAGAQLPILLYENETATTLHMALHNTTAQTISLLTGPEGGLEEQEVAKAAAAGFTVCTLGKRILRCETAPLCALSAVMYAVGEF